MKVVILAGGLGTRLSEYTDVIPKPMIMIGGKPILWHIMRSFAHFGHKDFVLALGYKAEVIKDYFLNYRNLSSDFSVDLDTGQVDSLEVDGIDWNVTLVNTGLESMTGGRVKRLKKYIGEAPFLLTYGDGVSDLDVNGLLEFHKQHGRMVTVTAVRPTARFGELFLDGDKVIEFVEKPQLGRGWINGGFFVVNPEFLDLIDGDSTLLERAPMEQATEMGQLMAYRHHGFWQCIDTKRDYEYLQEIWNTGDAPWQR